MPGKKVKKIALAAAVVFLLAGLSGAVALLCWPEFLARTALNYMLRGGAADEEILAGADLFAPLEKVPGMVPGQEAGAGPAPSPQPGAQEGAGAQQAVPPGPGGMVTGPQAESYSLIVNRYRGEFVDLRASYERRLNQLVGAAVSEYRANKDNKNFSKVKLAEKYVASGRALEKDCDGQFYATLAALEAELKAESLPTWVVGQAEKNYRAQKEARRRQILRQAAEGAGLKL